MKASNHLSAGYLVILPGPRPDWPPPWGPKELFPSWLISADEEIAERIPSHWDMPWANLSDADRLQNSPTLRLGIDLPEVKRMSAWVSERWQSGELGPTTNLFASLAAARTLIRTFLPPSSPATLIGVGLHPSLVDEFQVQCRSAQAPEYALYDNVHRRQALESEGQILGYELLGYHYGDVTSWLVHDVPGKLASDLGIRPNDHGLIEAFEDAMKGADYIARTGGVEPGWWKPWLIVKYPAF